MAAVLLFSCCTRAAVEDDFATATLSVGLDRTKADESASSVNVLYAVIYHEDGTEYQRLTLSGTEGIFDPFDVPVVRGETYQVALWAQNNQSGLFTVPEGDVRQVTATYGNVSVNNAVDAAFTYHGTFTLKEDKALSLVLKRAVSLVQVLSLSDPDLGQIPSGDLLVDVSFEGGVATTFDALTGTAGPGDGQVDFAPGSCSGDWVSGTGVDGGPVSLYEVAYVYVLPTGENASRIGARVQTTGGTLVGEFEATDVPLKANYRTALKGDLF